MKRFLLINESKWVTDIADVKKRDMQFEIVQASSMAEAYDYFKSVRPNVQALASDKQIHFAHITDDKKGTYETKWMFPHAEPVYGFPKGGCELAEDRYECAKREFKEETLSVITELPIDSFTVYEGGNYEFFVVEVTCERMQEIVDNFNKNKENNFGDGVEPNELLVFTKQHLRNPERLRSLNFISKKAMEILFQRMRGGKTRQRSSSSRRSRRRNRSNKN
jgi:8-oxo-dGTP pyrophosphatase MutT (NUDIX family)